jgi:hypothetical protein
MLDGCDQKRKPQLIMRLGLWFILLKIFFQLLILSLKTAPCESEADT